MTRMRPGALSPYTQRRLGPERAAQAQALRARLAGAGAPQGAWPEWPEWIDARPGRLQVVIGDCAADPPLSRTAAALIERHGDALVRGLGALALASGAPRMALAVRDDDEQAYQGLRRLLPPGETKVELYRVPPVWPSQPDVDVPGAWGRSWTLPAQVLERVDAVLTGRPPHRLCTVAGEVARPQVLERGEEDTPEDLIRRCGGARTPAWVAVAGGAPSGRLWDRDLPLAEEETLLLCLPQDHELVQRLRRPLLEELARGRAACPGCQLCTDACPQALRGAPLRPHLIASGRAPTGVAQEWAGQCTGCGACDAVCPRGVSPARLVSALALRARAERPPEVIAPLLPLTAGAASGEPPPEARDRRLPLPMLRTRLGLAGYAAP